MTRPETCGRAGGAVSLWYREINCPGRFRPGQPAAGLTTRSSGKSTGFSLNCIANFQTW